LGFLGTFFFELVCLDTSNQQGVEAALKILTLFSSALLLFHFFSHPFRGLPSALFWVRNFLSCYSLFFALRGRKLTQLPVFFFFSPYDFSLNLAGGVGWPVCGNMLRFCGSPCMAFPMILAKLNFEPIFRFGGTVTKAE